MSIGSFVFMLHSHLPYYRKAGMWPFGEESVYECMGETYIPLLNMIADLHDEGTPCNLTVGITPVLAEQLSDDHFKKGFLAYLDARLKAAEADEQRFSLRGTTPNPEYLRLAKFYVNWFRTTRDSFVNRWNQDIIAGFKKYQDLGTIEITTSAATHCFSPLLADDASLQAQFRSGADNYEKHFGRRAKGVWLPECAYRPAEDGRPSIDKWLHDAGLGFFFTESTVIEGGERSGIRRVFGPYGTIEYLPTPDYPKTDYDTYEAYWLKDYPVAVMGRHEQAGYSVWSADHGYPGDPNYREFHKKDDVSGLHYWKLTSKNTDLGDKQIYNPEAAMHRINENSDHYVGVVQQVLHSYFKKTGEQGLVMVSFDTELFGHWWFEGITFIKQVLQKLNKYTKVKVRTASDYLEVRPPKHTIELPESSWGSGGHYQVWLNEDTKWMWPDINNREMLMHKLVEQYADSKDALVVRVMKQLGREQFLLQSSDWPFLVTTGQAKVYAIERFTEHCQRFDTLAQMLENGVKIDVKALEEIESIDVCFSELNLDNFKEPANVGEISTVK
ncbi:MAG: DUF1957 domain-containing protein [Cyanobacteria bacterium TGS_CYA1]|nr:DUF1957 domain-containing protein [Cyanobacteria bacterium TGS_CYA1]